MLSECWKHSDNPLSNTLRLLRGVAAAVSGTFYGLPNSLVEALGPTLEFEVGEGFVGVRVNGDCLLIDHIPFFY